MANKVSAFVVTLQQDMNAEDADQFAKALGLLRGVVSVDPVHPDFLRDQPTLARTRQRVYEALADAFDPKRSQKGS